MTSTSITLGPAQARRIALSAQGFGRPRPDRAIGTRDLQRVIDTVGVVQIDSVNVLSRSHYLPFFSRLGPYDPALLDRMRDRAPRRLVEYWAHEASLIPPTTWPLLDFRMRRAEQEAWGDIRAVARQHGDLVEAVHDEVALRGPLTGREVEAALAHDLPRDRDQWGWNWSLVKHSLELLFWSGRISSAGRTAQFERRYAVPAAVLPPGAISATARPDEATAVKDLIEIAARALGVGTEQCLRDYFRLSPDLARPAIAALVVDGILVPATVTGWRRRAFLHAEARRPRRIEATALLSPFDSLIWQRDRTAALFRFDYRLEIYVPAPKRVHGYYVLPLLHGEELIARADLKADRAASVLRVQQVTWEPGRGVRDDARALESELEQLAGWLHLASISDQQHNSGRAGR